ncbi:hypothetical protein VTJ04DRAFT_588 [Mycothermus thermophilus]|uniref:uncharacterized protein n=1 Tax=Humicola insolens TaxID=85995 RepID=UPI003744519F
MSGEGDDSLFFLILPFSLFHFVSLSMIALFFLLVSFLSFLSPCCPSWDRLWMDGVGRSHFTLGGHHHHPQAEKHRKITGWLLLVFGFAFLFFSFLFSSARSDRGWFGAFALLLSWPGSVFWLLIFGCFCFLIFSGQIFSVISCLLSSVFSAFPFPIFTSLHSFEPLISTA